MSCERFHEALSRHAAGGALMGEAAAHLRECAGCSARLEQQRRLLAEVDAELERTLAIEASPELVNRVIAGTRVAGESTWRFRAAWAGLAAAAALALGIYLRTPVDGPSVMSPRPSSGTTQASVATAPSSTAGVVVSPGGSNGGGLPPSNPTRMTPGARNRDALRAAVTARPSHSPRTRVDEPPVIVEPGQALAIARLYELLRQGRLTEKMLPPARSHEAAELSVAPLRIPDITVPDVDSVGHTDAVSRERQ